MRLTFLTVFPPNEPWAADLFHWFTVVMKYNIFLQEMVTGAKYLPNPIVLQDVESIGIGQLCAAAGASLRSLTFGVTVSDTPEPEMIVGKYIYIVASYISSLYFEKTPEHFSEYMHAVSHSKRYVLVIFTTLPAHIEDVKHLDYIAHPFGCTR